MSAVELLRRVKALPVRERQKFVLAVLTLEEVAVGHGQRKSRRVKWPDVEARAKRIFGDRVLPNLVLVEREEAASPGPNRLKAGLQTSHPRASR